jgi:hypothetical protein
MTEDPSVGEMMEAFQAMCAPLPIPWTVAKPRVKAWVRRNPEDARAALRVAYGELAGLPGVGPDA